MRPKLSYANVTATLALIIAFGGASAFAATQLAKNSVGAKQLKKNAVTAAKIKKEAVTAAKVKKGTLTGTQINASTLGKVPAAANADTVGGVGLAGLLSSDHVLTGSADAGEAGHFILRDPRTGLEVLTGQSGRLRLVNTNATDTIDGDGIGYAVTTPTATHINLAPGAHIDLVYEAAFFTYGQYVFMRRGSLVPLQLSCIRNGEVLPEALSCVAVG